jgi:hypothetical protein
MSYGPNYSDQFRRTAHSCPGRVRRHVRRNRVTLTAGDEAACFWGDILVSRFFGSSLEIAWASCASTDITKTAPPRKASQPRVRGRLRTRALSPEISQIEKDPSVRVIVTQGGAIAESRTHLSSRNPHPGRSGRDVAPSYQCSPSFEPSAAAVIIAGIPIATVASAIARVSIMTIPLDSTSSSRS